MGALSRRQLELLEEGQKISTKLRIVRLPLARREELTIKLRSLVDELVSLGRDRKATEIAIGGGVHCL